MLSPVAQCVAWRAPMQQCVWWLIRAPKWEWHIGLVLLCGCSGALEYPTTNSCGPINKSLFLSLQLLPRQKVPFINLYSEHLFRHDSYYCKKIIKYISVHLFRSGSDTINKIYHLINIQLLQSNQYTQSMIKIIKWIRSISHVISQMACQVLHLVVDITIDKQ